ncbi:Sec-independent protein translocase protein TatB [Sulfurimonas sp.]
MFGMGFTEILIIAVIAILFLGPDKLPSTMVDIAKFFRSVKNTIGNVKESLEEEMNVSQIKQEALAYKKELLEASSKLGSATNIGANLNSEIDNILNDDESTPVESKKESTKPQEVTFKKKKKKSKKASKEEVKPTEEENKDV